MAAVSEYFIGKGIPYFKAEDAMDYVDMGNAPKVEVEPSQDTLVHNSSRAGVKKEDREETVSQSVTLNLTLENFTLENLALAFSSDIETNTDGKRVIRINSKASVKGAFRLVGTNDVGAKYQLDLPSVTLRPNGAIGFISEEWASIELTGKVLFDEANGDFGTIEELALEGEVAT